MTVLGMWKSSDRPEPPTNGTYVCEVYFGWKILEWKDGEWWHPNTVGRWTASEPLQWVGPLPDLVRVEKPQKEYDL